MTDTDTASPDTSTTDDAATATAGDPTPDASLGAAGEKALEAFKVRAREAEKQTKDLAAKVKKYEDRDKSESDKAAEKAAEAEKRATNAETKLMRVEIAAAKGLDPDMAARLVGDTREELEADATAFAKKIKAPTPGFDGGARSAAPDLDVDAGIRRMAGRA